MPASLVTAARDSVGRAVGVAKDPTHPLPARVRAEIISAAHQSFIGGLHLASVVAAAIVLVAVAGVVIWLPARAVDEVDENVVAGIDPEPVVAVGAATP